MRQSRLSLLALVCVASVSQVAAQNGPLDLEAYTKPPKEIQTFLDAPRHLNTLLGDQSPDGKRFLVAVSAGMPRLQDMAKPYFNLGGLQVDARANRARALSIRGAAQYTVIDSSDWSRVTIDAPKGSLMSDAAWSPDGETIAFLAHFDDATHLYTFRGKVRRVTDTPLLLTTGRFAWTGDSKSVFCILPPHERVQPQRSSVALQPRVQVADPAKNRLRTYRSLLKNAEDRTLLEYSITGQLAKVDVATGKAQLIGKPAMIRAFDPAPKGDYVRVTTYQGPFSYLVPVSSFGEKEEVWDLDGKVLTELRNRKITAADTAGPATPPADPRRGLAWRPDGNGLSYIASAEERPAPAAPASEDDDDEQGRGGGGGRGGQAGSTGPRKEKLVQWLAPFRTEDARTVYQSDTGIGSVQYSADGRTIYVTETASGAESLYAIDPKAPSSRKVIYTYRTGSATVPTLNTPGTLVLTDGPLGRSVVREQSGHVFLRGTQNASDPAKEAPRPFLDKVEVSTAKTTRLWQSPADAYETLNSFLDSEGTRLLIDRQSPTEVNNSYLWESGKLGRKLTDNQDYAPDLTAAKRYRVQITRADGFKFWVKVTAPKWSWEGVKLPAMFWFYPSEFTDQAAYDRGQRNFNKNLFPTVGSTSMALLTRMGYAFVEPDCPIVGPTGRINDNYINDLRNNLSATIDELERKGLIDRTKLALGGHSYGGFSTGNAMVHTPFFKAGIAGAGNYNRTLTPMSFQSETRDLFEARNTYLEMSSILNADHLTGALLMYCGMEDQNVGTDPINSEQMYHVLESIGKPAALYMYPYEDHGQVAKETIQDMWARWIAWLEKYVTPKTP